MSLSQKVPIICGMRVNCLKKKLNIQSSLPGVLLKTLCRSLFFNWLATFLKKGLQLSGLRLQLLSMRIICQEHFKVNMGRMRAKDSGYLPPHFNNFGF